MAQATGSTAGLPDQNTASGYAILHGLARRAAPQTQGAPGAAQAVGRDKKAPPELGLQRGHREVLNRE